MPRTSGELWLWCSHFDINYCTAAITSPAKEPGWPLVRAAGARMRGSIVPLAMQWLDGAERGSPGYRGGLLAA